MNILKRSLLVAACLILCCGQRTLLPPTPTVLIYVDPAGGNNANTGLTLAAPMRDMQACVYAVEQNWEYTAYNGSVVCALLHSSVDDESGCVHFSPNGSDGGQGGAELVIDLGGNTLSCTSNTTLGFFVNTVVQVRSRCAPTYAATCPGTIEVNNPGGAAISAGYHSYVDILDGVQFAGVRGYDLVASDDAIVALGNNITSSGSVVYPLFVGDNGQITAKAALTYSGSLTGVAVTAWATGGRLSVEGANFSGLSVSAGAKRAEADFGGIIVSATLNCNADFPGTVAASQGWGGGCW